jgi:hypothetical protein
MTSFYMAINHDDVNQPRVGELIRPPVLWRG